MQTQKVIERLGYSAKEAKVYLAVLSLGECHISDVATKLKLPPSSVQIIVNKLHKDGLLNFYVRRRYKYWVAESPVHLLSRLKEHEDAVRAVLPKLEALQNLAEGKTRTKVFEGIEEIRLIYTDIIETKQQILSIIPWDIWIQLLGRGFLEDFIETRMRHSLPIRTLMPRTHVTEELKEKDGKELRQTRFLPEHIRIASTTFIYGDKVAIISLNKKLPTAVLIEDAAIRDTITVFFEALWNVSQEQ